MGAPLKPLSPSSGRPRSYVDHVQIEMQLVEANKDSSDDKARKRKEKKMRKLQKVRESAEVEAATMVDDGTAETKKKKKKKRKAEEEENVNACELEVKKSKVEATETS